MVSTRVIFLLSSCLAFGAPLESASEPSSDDGPSSLPELGIRVTQNGLAVTVPSTLAAGYLELSGALSDEAKQLLNQPVPNIPRYAALIHMDTVAKAQDAQNGIASANLLSFANPGNALAYVMSFDGPASCACLDRDKIPAPALDPPYTWRCSPKKMRYAGKVGLPDVNLARFNLVVDTLRNATAVAILDTIKVKNTLVPPEVDAIYMKAAGLPESAVNTAHGFFARQQYALYEQVVRENSNCPTPVVECGKASKDPCDQFPPNPSS